MTEGPRLRVLSLGAGVQSTTLALLAAHGALGQMPDCAIFADTQSEPRAVYEHLKWLMSANVLPFPVHVVTVGSLKHDLMRDADSRDRFVAIPYFLDRAQQGAEQGMGRRQCTREYKLEPISKKLRELLGAFPRQRIAKASVEVWLGISTDEAMRMKQSRVAWQDNRFPLVELRMSRSDCLGWLERQGYPVPTKSACTFCPYRSDESWLRMKADDPEAWADAVQVDAGLRSAQAELRLSAVPYLHRSLQPLNEVDLRSWVERGQPDLFGEECEGMCGV